MQGSYEEQLKFYRSRIIKRIQGYADDIGPTYRLYVDSVLACDDLEQLKEMAELDLQLEYFEYIRKINSELKVFGVSLDDIQRKNNADNESNQESYGIENIGNVTESDIEASGIDNEEYDDSEEDEDSDYEEDEEDSDDSDDNDEIRASEADSLLQMLGNFREVEDSDEYCAVDTDEEDYGIDDLAQIEGFTGEEDEEDSEDEEVEPDSEYEDNEDEDTSIFGEIDDDGEVDDTEDDEEYNSDSDGDSEDDSDIDFLSDFEDNLRNLENNSGTEQIDEFGNEIDENSIEDNDSVFGEIDESYDEYDDSYDENEDNTEYDDNTDNDNFSLFGEIDDSDGDTEDNDEEPDETDDADTDDFNVFGEIDDSDVYDGDDIEEDEYEADDNDSIFGEIDDDDVYDGEDIDEEELDDNDSIFGEIDDSDYVDDEEDEESEDVGDILDKQMKQYENGEITDEDDAGYFGDLDNSDNERSSTGFVKGSIMDQYAAKNGIVAFQDKKVNDVYNGMAKVMLRGADMASEGLKKKFGKFFDLKH